MRRLWLGLFVGWLAVFAFSPVAAQAADPETTPSALVSGLVHDAVERLSVKGLSRTSREQVVQTLITQYTKVEALSEHVLGRSWDSASSQERSQFEDRFDAYMVAMCAGMLKDVPADTKFVVKGEQEQGADVVVHTVFEDGSGEPTRVDWTVAHASDGHLYLADVASDGVSFLHTMGSDFRAVLFANGGHIAGLLAAMNKKILLTAATD